MKVSVWINVTMSAPLAFNLTHIVNETEMNSEHADKLTPEKQSGDGNEKRGRTDQLEKVNGDWRWWWWWWWWVGWGGHAAMSVNWTRSNFSAESACQRCCFIYAVTHTHCSVCVAVVEVFRSFTLNWQYYNIKIPQHLTVLSFNSTTCNL